MSQITIPSDEQIMRMFDEYEMLPNIREHSMKVAAVADAVCSLLPSGSQIDNPLVHAAALLHDITKTQSLVTRESHAASAERLLAGLGYPEIASIVGQHIQLAGFDETAPLNEAEIVFYADKRVCHSDIVSEGRRIDDLLLRYGKTQGDRDRISALGVFVRRLGEKIRARCSDSLEEALARL